MPRELVPLDKISAPQASLFAEAIALATRARTSSQQQRLQQVYSLLEPKLLRPDILTRIVTGGQSRFTPLCADHKPLNASPVHSIFLLIQLEVGIKLNSIFQAGRDKVGPRLWDNTILNIRSLHGLWMPADLLKKTFQDSLKLKTNAGDDDRYYQKWHFENSGCEACMINHIIGDAQTLYGLWAVCRSRFPVGSRRPKIPRLLPWIDLWIEQFAAQYRQAGYQHIADDHLELATDLANETRHLRNNLRKHKNRHGKRGDQTESRPQDSLPASRTRKVVGRAPEHLHHDQTRPQAAAAAEQDPRTAKISPAPRSSPFHEVDEVSDVSDLDEETAFHHAPNPLYGSFTALISTPFLPNMSPEQHKDAEASLSHFALLDPIESNGNKVETDKAYAGHQSNHSNKHYTSQVFRPPMAQYIDRNEELKNQQSAYLLPKSTYTERKDRDQTTNRQSAEPSLMRHSTTSAWTDMSVPSSESGKDVSQNSEAYRALPSFGCSRNRLGQISEEHSLEDEHDRLLREEEKMLKASLTARMSQPFSPAIMILSPEIQDQSNRRNPPRSHRWTPHQPVKTPKMGTGAAYGSSAHTYKRANGVSQRTSPMLDRRARVSLAKSHEPTRQPGLRPVSAVSQQTTWTGMCKKLAVAEKHEYWSSRPLPWADKN